MSVLDDKRHSVYISVCENRNINFIKCLFIIYTRFDDFLNYISSSEADIYHGHTFAQKAYRGRI